MGFIFYGRDDSISDCITNQILKVSEIQSWWFIEVCGRYAPVMAAMVHRGL
jgi:hypothetical protein